MKAKFSPLSARIAVKSSLMLTIIGIVVLYFGFDQTLSTVLVYALLLFAGSFVCTYYYSAKMFRERLEKLYQIVDNISQEKFNFSDSYKPGHKDELDDLIRNTISANHTVRMELNRLNKIENYRKEFIGDISHELKTPIFAIQGFVETLLTGAIYDSEVNELFLKKTMRNVNRLIFLTNDLMEISKLETGELKSSIKEVYLRDIVLDVMESLQYKAQQEGIELRLKDFSKYLQVKVDRNQIRQVLINLIENGMKYNKPDGYVEIGTKESRQNKDKIILYVKDTGIGIDPHDIGRVTERFFRIDKSRSREKGGTGLGLAIVKHIIEAHGEKLMIESKAEVGSEFSITLTKVSNVSV